MIRLWVVLSFLTLPSFAFATDFESKQCKELSEGIQGTYLISKHCSLSGGCSDNLGQWEVLPFVEDAYTLNITLNDQPTVSRPITIAEKYNQRPSLGLFCLLIDPQAAPPQRELIVLRQTVTDGKVQSFEIMADDGMWMKLERKPL